MKIIKQSFEIIYPNITYETIQLEMLKRIETAGRVCYKSEDKITPESSSEFVGMIVKRGHHSVLEHESVRVKFITDRGVTHELVRHRIGVAFSQESTRYCDYGGGDVVFILPVWMGEEWLGKWYGAGCDERIERMQFDDTLKKGELDWLEAMGYAEDYYHILRKDCGWTPQQARSVLPNSLKTEIEMTANLREWLHVFTLRTSKAAHPQMSELMRPLLKIFAEAFPEIYLDLQKEVEEGIA